MAIEQDKRANGRTPGKKISRHFVAQHNDVPLLVFIKIIEPAPLLQGEIADSVVLRLGPRKLTARTGEFAHRMYVIGCKYRRNCLYMRSFF